MALDVSTVVPGDELLAVHVYQFFNLLTGIMTDQPVTLANTLAVEGSSANALVVGPNGTTHPVLNVQTNTASQATGVNIAGKAAGSGIALIATSSAVNEGLSLDALGTGTITLNGVATGKVVIGNGLESATISPDGTHTLTLPSATSTLAALGVAQNFTALQEFSAGVSPDGTHTLTLPSVTDTLVGRATTDTLTNKTLTSPSMTTAVVTSGGLQVTAGNVGIGSAPLAQIGAYISPSTILNTAGVDYGYLAEATFGALVTDARAVQGHPEIAASAAVTLSSSLYAQNPSLGAGASIGTARGLLVESITAGSNNNYGIYVNAPSGGSGSNVGVYVAGGGLTVAAGVIAATGGITAGTNTQLDLQIDGLKNVAFGRSSGYSIVFYSNGTNTTGIAVGGPTGGDKGAGTINVATGVYLNGTAFTNPAFVLEHWATGSIVANAAKKGAARYKGLHSLADVERSARERFELPMFGPEFDHDVFSGGEALLLHLEEAYLHLIAHERRIERLEQIVGSPA